MNFVGRSRLGWAVIVSSPVSLRLASGSYRGTEVPLRRSGCRPSAAGGSIDVEWFSPQTGDIRKGESIAGGAVRAFESPFAGDAVLYLRRAGI